MAFRISTETRGGGTVYTLHDDATGASAAVLPSFGFNLFDLRLPAAGAVRPIVSAEPDFADNPRSPGRNGTPVLFPFPNRIDGGRYTFEGRSYQIPVNSGAHAIHGFAIQAPWDVIEHKADDTAARITGRFRISVQSPEMISAWPTDAVLEITYTLAGRRLTLDAVVSNPTDRPLPYGFGIHPYYRLPLTADGDPMKTRLVLPASEVWVLRPDLIPTGERRPVDERLDFRAGKSFGGMKLDDVLTGLEGDPRVVRLIDDGLGAEFRITFGTEFRDLVAFTPPAPEGVIAIEPYTMPTDAINLQARGLDAGLRVLGHGERDELKIVVETRDLG
jgi:aldose 1-epimerase